MSTTQPTSAISFENGKPLWDLTSVTAYPASIPRGTQNYAVNVFMAPYEADSLKSVLRKAQGGYKREKQDVEIFREDRSIYVPLFDAHFVKLGNSTGTPEQQREYFDRNPAAKPAIVEFTFGGLTLETPKDAEDGSDVFDIFATTSSSIQVYQNIYDPVTDKIVRVDMLHEYKQPTEGQYREYRGARRSKFVRKTTLWTVSENHNVLEKLYDSVISSISGAKVNGKPCTAATKAEWLSGVPLWHKLLVVDQIFGELVEKND